MPDLWTRIRKARLFQVLVVYVAVSWVILQVADVLEDTLELPSWVAAAALLLLLAGGVVVMTTAWLQAHPPALPEADGVVTPRERAVHRWVLPQFTWVRAIAGGVLALGLLALVALIVAGDGRPRLGPGEARADVAGVGLAVLPFNVSGPDAELWREGMLDLLATNLDGVAGLRTIDPATILSRMRGDRDVELAAQLRVADDVQARYALIGSVIGLSSNVRISSEIHDLDTDTVVARARVEGPQDSVLRLVDRLSVDLVRQLMRSEGGETGLRNAETLTTGSLEALRSYLEAERLYRGGDLDAASAAYERAVREDSTFALAWYGLSRSRGWFSGELMQALSDSAFQRATLLADRLPERTRMFLRGDSLNRAGDAESIRVFESAVARYPDDPEAWYMLGEVRFHTDAGGMGIGLEERVRPFRRAVLLDPSSGPYYYHLVPAMIGLQDTLAADSLIRRFESFTGDRERAEGWRMARAVLKPPTALDAQATAEALSGATPDQIRLVVEAATSTTSYPAALEGAAIAGRRAGIQPSQLFGAPFIARIEQGRLSEIVEFVAAEQTPAVVIPPTLSHVLMLGGDVPEPLAERYLTTEHDGGRASFWAGVRAWLREDADGVRRAMLVLDSLAAGRDVSERGEAYRAPPAAMAEAFRTQAGGLRALELALRDGRPHAAADSLQAVLRRAHSTPTLDAEIAMVAMREIMVQMYISSDRPQQALELVQNRVSARPSPLLAFLLARIHEGLGDRNEAIRHYSIFLEGWRNADEGLPWKAHAERALERLTQER